MLGDLIKLDQEEADLIRRARAGDGAADQEVISRAMGGSPRCQRAILGALWAAFDAGMMATAVYVDRAEPFCRVAMRRGDAIDLRQLAAILELKARAIRQAGGAEADALAAEVEALAILDRLCDDGDEPALAMLGEMAPLMPHALSVARLSARSRPSPPATLAWTGALAPLLGPEPSRWERLRWWAEDRWWDCRGWFGDRLWAAEMLWWRIRDRLEDGGSR